MNSIFFEAAFPTALFVTAAAKTPSMAMATASNDLFCICSFLIF